MVWKLADLCLKCVQQNLDKYPNLGLCLPTQYKELLIHRLSCHDLYHQESLSHIFTNFFSSRLRHIRLEGSDQITDTVLQHLGASGCVLETLCLKRLDNVTDTGVLAVTNGQTSLYVVNLRHVKYLTQKVMSGIASPRLWCFKFVQCMPVLKPWCTQTVLADFLSKNPALRYLKIDLHMDKVPLIARCLGPSLEQLQTNFQAATDESIETLAQYCPNLKSLDLNGARHIGKESLIKLFQACTQLNELYLDYCTRLASPPENEVLWTLPQSLTSLSLCGLLLKDSDILVECITRLPRIKSLKLCGVPALDDDSLTKLVEKIGHQLTNLNLSGVTEKEITDEGLRSVSKYCTHLESFHLSLLQQVTGVTLRPLFADPVRAGKIKELSVNSKHFDVSVLEEIVSSMPNLDTLALSGLTFVTDTMVITLADHSPKLTQLFLKGCKQITDTAICYLSGSCPLSKLGLSGLNSLTDKSIFCLASSCPQLEEIYLNGCAHISPVAVQYLQDCCLKRLFVKHTIPNASPNQLMAKNLDTGEFCRADLM